MAEREVIEILDSDPEDEIQVISDSPRRERPQSAPNIRPDNYRNIGHIRQNFAGPGGNNSQEIGVDDDDDVQIVSETINLRERSEPSPGLIIYTPNGPITIGDQDSSAEPERRSFQNARGPVEPGHFRTSEEMARSADERRRRDRHEQLYRMQQIEALQRQENRRRRTGILRNNSPVAAAPSNIMFHNNGRGRGRQARGRGRGRVTRPRMRPEAFDLGRDSPRNESMRFWQNLVLMGGPLPAPLQELFFEDDEDEFDDPDYHPGMLIHNAGGHGHNGDDQHVMNIIQQREDQEADKKRSINESFTISVQRQCEERIRSIKAPFTTTIDPEESYVCILCGVTLGEGIPPDFNGNISKTQLPVLQEQNDVQAPYQGLKLITDADRDLSKRIFMSSCGHTYCGRCVKNISSVRGTLRSKAKLKFKKEDNDIENPFIYAPLKCIGTNCAVGLGAKKRFNEIFI